MRKAIATIETESGTMAIYYNGANQGMTAEKGETVEEIGCTPAYIGEAEEAVWDMYHYDPAWDLQMLDYEEEPEYFFAVLMDEEDDDWGTGSSDSEAAVKMAQEFREYGHPDAYVAVIEIGPDPICVREIHDLEEV